MAQAETDIPIMRIPISLPCTVPVLPGTADTTAPIEERTERCATDAFWVVGRAPICDIHLRVLFGDDEYEAIHADHQAQGYTDLRDTRPWADHHRYPQADAVMLGDRAGI